MRTCRRAGHHPLKHQSAWETVGPADLVPERTYCVFVLKKELLRLPFFGWGWRRCR